MVSLALISPVPQEETVHGVNKALSAEPSLDSDLSLRDAAGILFSAEALVSTTGLPTCKEKPLVK